MLSFPSGKFRIVEKMTKEHNKKIAETYYNSGLAHSEKGKLDLAISDFTKAIELNPDYAEAYKGRGDVYRNKGDLEKAIADYTQMLVLKPKIPIFYYIRGEAYLRAKQWEEAKRDLTAAILQGVDITDAFHNTHKSIAAFEEKIGVQLPENIVHLLSSNPESFEIDEEARIALGMKYYENEELSSGLAARLAGVPRVEFWYLMGDYGLSLFGTAEDLKEELENTRKVGH